MAEISDDVRIATRIVLGVTLIILTLITAVTAYNIAYEYTVRSLAGQGVCVVNGIWEKCR